MDSVSQLRNVDSVSWNLQDVLGLAQAMLWVLTDEKLRARLALAARHTALRYTPEAIADRCALYPKLVTRVTRCTQPQTPKMDCKLVAQGRHLGPHNIPMAGICCRLRLAALRLIKCLGPWFWFLPMIASWRYSPSVS